MKDFDRVKRKNPASDILYVDPAAHIYFKSHCIKSSGLKVISRIGDCSLKTMLTVDFPYFLSWYSQTKGNELKVIGTKKLPVNLEQTAKIWYSGHLNEINQQKLLSRIFC